MATIKVTAKIGNTFHPKYGALVEGQEYTIDEADFGDEIFEKVDGSRRLQPANDEGAAPEADTRSARNFKSNKQTKEE
jgi:hypothetical protein